MDMNEDVLSSIARTAEKTRYCINAGSVMQCAVHR